jgi:hypothetical protein
MPNVPLFGFRSLRDLPLFAFRICGILKAEQKTELLSGIYKMENGF